MRLSVKLIITGLVGALLVVGLTATAKAANSPVTKQVRISDNETYRGTLVRSAQTIDISGKVEGDVFIAAQSVTIDGEITGNVYVAAQTITIRGHIGGGIHAAGATVFIGGKVDHNAVLAGATVELDKQAKVGGSLMTAGTTVRVAADVNGSSYVAAGTLRLSGSMAGAVTVASDNLVVSDGAKVEGDLKYYSKNQALIDSGAKITGSVIHETPKQQSTGSVAAKHFGRAIYEILSGLIILAVLLFVAPRTTLSVADELNEHPGRSFLAGVLAIIVTPIVIVFGLVSLIGISAALILASAYVSVIVLGMVFFALWLGRVVMGKTSHGGYGTMVVAALVGLALVALIRLIPVVGGLFSFIAFFFGTGALVSRLMRRVGVLHNSQRLAHAKS